jgi:hypothetical protein
VTSSFKRPHYLRPNKTDGTKASSTTTASAIMFVMKIKTVQEVLFFVEIIFENPSSLSNQQQSLLLFSINRVLN